MHNINGAKNNISQNKHSTWFLHANVVNFKKIYEITSS